MILGQISYLDCLAFVLFLIPQLLYHVAPFQLLGVIIRVIPFLFIKLPFQFVVERFFTSKYRRSPFAQQSTLFQDVVIRCVQYAFAEIPAAVGRVFFSKGVALPFVRFRMLRHGFLRSPVSWRELDPLETNGVRGVLITIDPNTEPDVVFYYCHGGGFAMGSTYFYLEPLLVLCSLLKEHYRNPAVFGLEYDLVPDRVWPLQLQQTIAGYQYARFLVGGDSARVCVGGDSAGGTLILSLLLSLAKDGPAAPVKKPGYCTLFSPWVTLISEEDQNTASDYLNAETLHLYARQYANSTGNLTEPLASPGCCNDLHWWRDASPHHGIYLTYGSEEVFAPEIRRLTKRLREAAVPLRVREEPGLPHAWVIASLFLAESLQERIGPLAEVARAIAANIPPRRMKGRNGHAAPVKR